MRTINKKKLVKEWFLELQNIIFGTIEQLESDHGSNTKFKKKTNKS